MKPTVRNKITDIIEAFDEAYNKGCKGLGFNSVARFKTHEVYQLHSFNIINDEEYTMLVKVIKKFCKKMCEKVSAN